MLALFKNKKYSKEELHEELIKSWSEYYIKCYNYQNQKRELIIQLMGKILMMY